MDTTATCSRCGFDKTDEHLHQLRCEMYRLGQELNETRSKFQRTIDKIQKYQKTKQQSIKMSS